MGEAIRAVYAKFGDDLEIERPAARSDDRGSRAADTEAAARYRRLGRRTPTTTGSGGRLGASGRSRQGNRRGPGEHSLPCFPTRSATRFRQPRPVADTTDRTAPTPTRCCRCCGSWTRCSTTPASSCCSTSATRLLLFPGDAQIENWSYALFDAPNRRAIRGRLAGTNLYKVGHHGSLNATPKTLWNGFAHKQSDAQADADRLISVLSTKANKHGHPENDTEVPRRPLVTALENFTAYQSTQNHTGKNPWADVDVPIR